MSMIFATPGLILTGVTIYKYFPSLYNNKLRMRSYRRACDQIVVAIFPVYKNEFDWLSATREKSAQQQLAVRKILQITLVAR